MKRPSKLLLSAAALSLCALAACGEEQSNNTQADQQQASADITGVYCSTTETSDLTLVVLDAPDSPFINFSTSEWHDNGQNCGIVNAFANQTDETTWFYEATQTDEESCKLEFKTAVDGTISITAASNTCKQLCGSSSQFGSMTFKPEDKVQDSVSADDIKGLYEGPDLCK